MMEPRTRYVSRLFSRSVVGWPGVQHLENTDYSTVVDAARLLPGWTRDTIDDYGHKKPLRTGFGADTVSANMDKIIDAVKAGSIKHFFMIGGCDGVVGRRSYFQELATSTPLDSVIFTAGCGKFRFNHLDLWNIDGIPRMMDMGQCNDTYGVLRVAQQLKDALGKEHINELPLSFALSWFEQKSVAVLLTLLHLGIKNIHLGPAMPAFLTPNLRAHLVDQFRLTPIGDAKADASKLAAMPENQ